jgi:FkbM family methyltransferase
MRLPPDIMAAARDPKKWGTLPAEVVGRLWRRDWRLLGGALALCGNMARLDECTFDLSHPSLTLRLKSRFVTDAYERAERRLIARHLPRDRAVLELGACLGVLACIVNRRLEDPSQHVVVEANPELIPVIRRNRELNAASFAIEHAAIAYGQAHVTLMVHPALATASSLKASVGEPRLVAALSLAALVARYRMQRAVLILDIEGAESDLIRNEGHTLAETFEWLLLELHPRLYGAAEAEYIRGALQSLEFQRVERIGEVEAWRNRRPGTVVA